MKIAGLPMWSHREGAGMEVGGIDRIRVVDPVGLRRSPGDVAPAFGVELAWGVCDGSYDESASRQHRGMEEEDTPENEDEQSGSVESISSRKVNLFA